MGCDIHIVIQRQEPSDKWVEVVWQETPHESIGPRAVSGIPMAPDIFRNRNYDLFAILADVRNGVGFAGIKRGEGWPSIAPLRGLPPGFDETKVAPNPQYPEDGEPRWLGDHSFTWVDLEELEAFLWDSTETWLYGVVPAADYERLSAASESPDSYSGEIIGPGIEVYEPDAYRMAKAMGRLAPRPYVRMGWPESARSATYDWPGKVIPWLKELAGGRPLRLVLGFDS